MGFQEIREKFGVYFADIGLSKTYGRIFGLFLTEKKPLSMGDVIDQMKISKSTASTEMRRLLAMGVIEKVSFPSKRAVFYRLKENIWGSNLTQKIHDIQKLRMIIEGEGTTKLEKSKGLLELSDYCLFMEKELKVLVKNYEKFLKEKNGKSKT